MALVVVQEADRVTAIAKVHLCGGGSSLSRGRRRHVGGGYVLARVFQHQKCVDAGHELDGDCPKNLRNVFHNVNIPMAMTCSAIAIATSSSD